MKRVIKASDFKVDGIPVYRNKDNTCYAYRRPKAKKGSDKGYIEFLNPKEATEWIQDHPEEFKEARICGSITTQQYEDDDFAYFRMPLEKYTYNYMMLGDTSRDQYFDYCEALLPDDEYAYILTLAKNYGYIDGWEFIDTSSETTEELIEAIEDLKEDEPEACAQLLSNPQRYLDIMSGDSHEPLTAIKQGKRYLYKYRQR